jgi:D-alanyl-D-alanine carboxypeptidase
MAKWRKYAKHHKKPILWLLIFFVVLALSIFLFHRHADEVKPATKTSTPSSSSTSSTTSTTTNKPAQTPFNKYQYSINKSSSLWVVVNKGRVLPSDYVPAGLRVFGSSGMSLRADAASALQQLFNGATNAGIHLMLVSGYRSYTTQVGLYNSYVASSGQASADTFSAKAGHSEHQTGLVGDLGSTSRQCELDVCFGNLLEGKWLAANAYKYGFIVRYPADKTSITGYQYEPWHMRYVGTALASEMHKTGVTTLEEFFGLQSFTSYPTNSYALSDN